MPAEGDAGNGVRKGRRGVCVVCVWRLCKELVSRWQMGMGVGQKGLRVACAVVALHA